MSYAIIEAVVPKPGEPTPRRVQIWGMFALKK
jgi:hypothetical protein